MILMFSYKIILAPPGQGRVERKAGGIVGVRRQEKQEGRHPGVGVSPFRLRAPLLLSGGGVLFVEDFDEFLHFLDNRARRVNISGGK